EKPVGSDAQKRIQLVALILAAKLDFVLSVNPGHGVRQGKGVLIVVGRARDGIANRCKATNLNERRSQLALERGRVPESQGGSSGVVQSLTGKEFVPQERETGN